MSEDAFFVRDGENYVPQPVCRGPWDPKSLHGRVISGLLGARIEQEFGDPGFQFTRMNVDLWRLPDFTPITVKSELLREGGRIKVVAAEAFAAGKSLGKATGVLLRRSEDPGGEVWKPEPWDMPAPEAFEPTPPPKDLPDNWRPMWETRGPGHSFGEAKRKRVWMREVRPLIAGVELTPWQRVAVAVDFTSPLAHAGTEGLQYINTDITVYLHRLPRGEWVGFDVESHQAAEGVAVGECCLYDEEGPIGRSLTAALAQKRKG